VTTTDIAAIDGAKLETFVGHAVTDMGAAISGLVLHIGDRLSLYKAMAGADPITSSVLAQRTGTTERYVREWLGNQAAGGYVIYNPADGSCELLVVEPNAGDALEDNLNPVGRTYYGLSTVICTPGSLAQEVGLGLGAQAGERQLAVVLAEAGFTHVRRAAETPFNIILEARP